jgi:hypothetical protein
VPKVHTKPIKRTRKGFNKESKGITEGCPGLAHRTVRCATGQCPVHQGTSSQTSHLREFSETLHYNSPDYTTGQCPVLQRRAALNSPASDFRSAIIYRTCPVHTGLSGEPAEQWLLRANSRLQRIKCAPARAGGTPDSLQDLSGAPPDSQAGPQVRAPTVGP